MSSVYDDSGTDWQYTRIAITLQAVLNQDFFQTIDSTLMNGAVAKGDLVQGTRWIRKRLLEPRKRLQVQISGQDLIPARQDKDAGNLNRTVDAKHGPQPRRCVINQLTEKTFLITYEIEAHYWENFSNADDAINSINKAGNAVVSCRWSETQEIDQRNFSKRVREGTIVIRSDNVDRQTIDNYRQDFAVVGIPFGFVRKRASYTVDPSGLKMRFHLEDQEVYLLPPYPAFEASGWYMETLSRMGAKKWAECQVELRGKKPSEAKEGKSKLVELALAIAMTKMKGARGEDVIRIIPGGDHAVLGTVAGFAFPAVGPFLGGVIGKEIKKQDKRVLEPPNFILENAWVRTDLYDNVVTANLRYMLEPPLSYAKANGVEAFNIPVISDPPLGSEVGVGDSPAVTSYGNPDVDLILRAAAYFDPSLQQKLDASLGQLNPTIPHGSPGTG